MKILTVILILVVFVQSQGWKGWGGSDAAKWRSDISDSIRVVSDTTALKKLNAPDGKYAYIERLSSENDNGSGFFVAVDSVYDESLRGAVFPHIENGKQWVRLAFLEGGDINPLWFGAKNNKGFNSTDAIEKALKFGRKLASARRVTLPSGEFAISYLQIKDGDELVGQRKVMGSRIGTKLYPAQDTDTMIVASDDDYTLTGATIKGLNLVGINGSDTAKIGIFVRNANNLEIEDCSFYKFYSSDTTTCIKIYGTTSPFKRSNAVLLRDLTLYQFDCGVYASNFHNLVIDGMHKWIWCNKDTPLDFGYYMKLWEGQQIYIHGINFNQDGTQPDSMDVIIAKSVSAGYISNCYVELGTSNGNFLKFIDDGSGLIGEYNHFILENINLKGGSSTAYAIDADLADNGVALDIIGGRWVPSSGNWIYAPWDDQQYRINIYNSRFSKTGSSGNAEMPYTIFGYNSDAFEKLNAHNPYYAMYHYWTWPDYRKSGFNGIRSQGASYGYGYNIHGTNLISKRIGGGSAGQFTFQQGDTIEITCAKWDGMIAREPWSAKLKFSLANSSGGYAELYRLTIDGVYTHYSTHLDTLIDNSTSIIKTDSVVVHSVTDSSIVVRIYANPGGSWTRYFLGELEYGNNIKSVTAERKD